MIPDASATQPTSKSPRQAAAEKLSNSVCFFQGAKFTSGKTFKCSTSSDLLKTCASGANCVSGSDGGQAVFHNSCFLSFHSKQWGDWPWNNKFEPFFCPGCRDPKEDTEA